MRLVMDRNGSALSGPSLSQLMAGAARRTPADRRALRAAQSRRRTARIALALGVMAFAASLGVMVGELARSAFGG